MTNLDAVVGNGIFAKDVLHHAMLGSMHTIIPKLFVPRSSSILEDINGAFLTVEQVLALMGFVPGAASSSQSPVDNGTA